MTVLRRLEFTNTYEVLMDNNFTEMQLLRLSKRGLAFTVPPSNSIEYQAPIKKRRIKEFRELHALSNQDIYGWSAAFIFIAG